MQMASQCICNIYDQGIFLNYLKKNVPSLTFRINSPALRIIINFQVECKYEILVTSEYTQLGIRKRGLAK